MEYLDPVDQLEMRAEFIEGVVNIAQLSYWDDQRIEEFRNMILDELASIDNMMYDIYEETGDREAAVYSWEEEMEKLRRWLSLIFGVKVKYI